MNYVYVYGQALNIEGLDRRFTLNPRMMRVSLQEPTWEECKTLVSNFFKDAKEVRSYYSTQKDGNKIYYCLVVGELDEWNVTLMVCKVQL